MANEAGEWIMYGVEEDDPCCIKTVEELIAYIDEVGFLPLFKNDIPGFSVEERTVSTYWWTGNERDPWAWREVIARSGEVVYGWPVAVYSMPEQLWGYDYVASAYKEDPEVSKERIYKRIREICPDATEKQMPKRLR